MSLGGKGHSESIFFPLLIARISFRCILIERHLFLAGVLSAREGRRNNSRQATEERVGERERQD